MTFSQALYLVTGLLYLEKRVTYRRLRREFELDQETLDDVCHELIVGRQLALDENGAVLVWTAAVAPPHEPSPHLVSPVADTACAPAQAERRQLTVMFCDLVGSTALSTRLDPEDLSDVIGRFQDACREAIQRYDGFIARYMGDGVLVYFGYPQAHEQDAERAVRAGLDVLASIPALNADVGTRHGVDVAARIGVATGLVVVGDIIGEGAAEEAAVLGETPNLAARLQGVAEPNQLVIASATGHLVAGTFDLEDAGEHALKGIASPVRVWRVAGERADDSDYEASRSTRSAPLVGRHEELGLLVRAWETSRRGQGQVVLVQGEPGIGKSRLLEALREQVASEEYAWVAIRCSPYHVNSTLFPIIEHLRRVAGWTPEDGVEQRLAKLENVLRGQSLPLDEVVPLYADLLSLPVPSHQHEASTLSPKQKREATLDAAVGWLLDQADRKPVLQVWEDLHWADPTTLEMLGMCIEQAPTVSMLNVLTYRADFSPPWSMRSHMTPITLNRLERPEVESMIGHHAGGKELPAEVVSHIADKADGVPLYVEELTKTVLASERLQEQAERFTLNGSLADLGIPATLQDSLMARLDRVPLVREVAQLGAVIGREFAYEMLQPLASLEDSALRNGLGHLVADELLYQRGRPPRSRYIFKHALIHDAAYQSLLKRSRQQHHARLAALLEERFPESVHAHPELLARHYSEAGDARKAVSYWLSAAERARRQSANLEAIAHLGQGLGMLAGLSDDEERARQELALQVALGNASLVARGHGSVEAESAYARARELCEQLGDTAELIPTLLGLWRFCIVVRPLCEAAELAGQLLRLAEQSRVTEQSVVAHYTLGFTACCKGDLADAREHFKRGSHRYSPSQRQAEVYRAAQDPGVACLAEDAVVSWLLGFPERASGAIRRAVELANDIEDAFSVAFAQIFGTIVAQVRVELAEGEKMAREALSLSTDLGFSLLATFARSDIAWSSFSASPTQSTLGELRESVEALRTSGVALLAPYYMTLLARAHHQIEQPCEGLRVLEQAESLIEKRDERWWEAEVHRLRGEVLLSKSAGNRAQAEGCFEQALQIARNQSAKSLELRAAMSLASLWRARDEIQRAAETLTPVYEWFTEGLDTGDLRVARALLDTIEASLSGVS